MAQTLDDVVLEQMQTNETLQRVDRRLDNFITLWFANKMDEMEMMRERLAPPAPAVPSENTKPEKGPEGLGFGLNMFGAALAAAVAGFALGIDEYLRAGLLLMRTGIQNVFLSLGKDFISLGKRFAAIFSKGGAIGKALTRVGTFIRPVTDFFRFIGFIFGKLAGVGKVIGNVGKFFEPIMKFAKTLTFTLGKLGFLFRIVGKLFLPLTAAIEVGMAIFKEMTSLGAGADIFDTFLGLAKGIIKGLYNIVLIPLDLIKDGVSWLMNKMGFSNFSKLLDSFSFSDTFGGIVDTMFNVLEGFARGAVAAIMAIAPGGDSPAQAFMKEWNNVMSGGTGSAPTVETMQVDTDANGNTVAKKVSGARNGRTNLAEMTPETLTQSIVTANKKSTADRLSKSSMREEVTGSIAKGTVTAGEGATVNITNVNNVNAPTSTQNNVSNGTSRRENRSLSPVHNNGYLSSAYSF
jgi:hypothetical protein